MYMKKSILFSLMLLVTLSFSFSSCSKDDEISDNSIVGIWSFLNLTAELENDTNEEALEFHQGIIALSTVILQGTTIEFKSNNTLIVSAAGQKIEGSYKKEGGKYIVTIDDVDDIIGEDELINSDAFLSLENGTLILTSDNLDDELKEEGFTKYIMTMTFKK